MDNYYDSETGEWVTNWSRYERVLAEPRFEPIREATIVSWSPAQAWALILELLAAVPDDTVSNVGAGPLEAFVRQHAPTFIEEIEAELQRNARLRRAVIEINLQRDELAPEIEARVVAAFGPKFWLLDGGAG